MIERHHPKSKALGPSDKEVTKAKESPKGLALSWATVIDSSASQMQLEAGVGARGLREPVDGIIVIVEDVCQLADHGLSIFDQFADRRAS